MTCPPILKRSQTDDPYRDIFDLFKLTRLLIVTRNRDDVLRLIYENMSLSHTFSSALPSNNTILMGWRNFLLTCKEGESVFFVKHCQPSDTTPMPGSVYCDLVTESFNSALVPDISLDSRKKNINDRWAEWMRAVIFGVTSLEEEESIELAENHELLNRERDLHIEAHTHILCMIWTTQFLIDLISFHQTRLKDTSTSEDHIRRIDGLLSGFTSKRTISDSNIQKVRNHAMLSLVSSAAVVHDIMYRNIGRATKVDPYGIYFSSGISKEGVSTGGWEQAKQVGHQLNTGINDFAWIVFLTSAGLDPSEFFILEWELFDNRRWNIALDTNKNKIRPPLILKIGGVYYVQLVDLFIGQRVRSSRTNRTRLNIGLIPNDPHTWTLIECTGLSHAIYVWAKKYTQRPFNWTCNLASRLVNLCH